MPILAVETTSTAVGKDTDMPNLGRVRAPKATKHPSLIDIAWAAGIYEGEGCTTMYGSRQVGRATIQVAQKDPWILDRLVELFGGSVYKPAPSQRSECHTWRITGSRGAGFAQTIFTFLSPRRRAQMRRKFQWV